MTFGIYICEFIYNLEWIPCIICLFDKCSAYFYQKTGFLFSFKKIGLYFRKYFRILPWLPPHMPCFSTHHHISQLTKHKTYNIRDPGSSPGCVSCLIMTILADVFNLHAEWFISFLKPTVCEELETINVLSEIEASLLIGTHCKGWDISYGGRQIVIAL